MNNYNNDSPINGEKEREPPQIYNELHEGEGIDIRRQTSAEREEKRKITTTNARIYNKLHEGENPLTFPPTGGRELKGGGY